MANSTAKQPINQSGAMLRLVLRSEDRDMSLVADYSEALSWKIGTFRPSDRAALKDALFDSNRGDQAIKAVLLYLQGWEESEWLEDYAIERLAIWLHGNAPVGTVRKLQSSFPETPHPVYVLFNKAAAAAENEKTPA